MFQCEVPTAAESLGVSRIRIAVHSPWQNGIAERFVGSWRRDLLDHVIVRTERHLKRILACRFARSTATELISDWICKFLLSHKPALTRRFVAYFGPPPIAEIFFV